MKTKSLLSLAVIVIFCLPIGVSAQLDSIGVLDTVYAEISQVDEMNWTVTFSYSSDADIVGLSFPFKISAGLNRIVADSIKYDARVADFSYKTMRADSAIQCVTIGLIANVGPGNKVMKAGSGRVATVYISSIEDKPIEALTIDTTTTHPNNTLMAAACILQGTPPDTVRITHAQQKILPAFVILKSK